MLSLSMVCVHSLIFVDKLPVFRGVKRNRKKLQKKSRKMNGKLNVVLKKIQEVSSLKVKLTQMKSKYIL